MEAEANADSRRRAEAEQTLVELRRNRTALDEEMRRVESELRGGAAAEVVSTPLTSGETQVSGDDFTLTLQPCVLCSGTVWQVKHFGETGMCLTLVQAAMYVTPPPHTAGAGAVSFVAV